MSNIILLDNVRSVHNVASIFRTASVAGYKKIFLFGNTPTPIDRFGMERDDFKKVSLGAENHIDWKHFKTMDKILKEIEGFNIISIEQTAKAIPYNDYKYKGKNVLIFGEEVKGVSEAFLQRSDVVLEIPIYGEKESLNVSVCAGIILFSCVLNSN